MNGKLGYLFFLILCLLAVPVFAAEPQVQIQNLPAPTATEMINGFVITSPQGIKCFLDTAAVPDALKNEFSNTANIMAFSHTAVDHYNNRIYKDFQGQKVIKNAIIIKSGDITLETVKASNSGDEPDGSTYIIIVDVAGFRIVHFGDCAQAALTPEQKNKIGHVDLAISQFEDSFSGVDFSNKICYKLMEQVNPTLIVPTHIHSVPGVKLLNQKWPSEIAQSDTLILSKSLLEKGKRSIFMPSNTVAAKKANIAASKDL